MCSLDAHVLCVGRSSHSQSVGHSSLVMSIIIKARPASARPASHTVSFGSSAVHESHAHQPPHRPSSAFTPASLGPSAAPTPQPSSRSPSRSPSRLASEYATREKPPFRPASSHPRDATFYSSTYMTSSTSGVTARERERSRERSPTRQRPASAIVTSTSTAAASNPQHAHSTADMHGKPSLASSHTSSTSHMHTGPIPVRHTRRTSEYASRLSVEPTMAKSGEWTEQAVRAHFEPLLTSKQTKFADLKQRYKKQEARLMTMQSWRTKALDQANSEPNPLDYVLSADNGVVESLRVRQKRIVLQRTLIRQFLRTFRLLRSLKTVHRHLRTMLPLLLDSPNSQLSTETRTLLKDVISTWGQEPLPPSTGGAGGSASPRKAGRFGFEQSIPHGDNKSPSNSADPRSTSAADQARQAQDFLFYRQHPHSYTNKLLSNLFDVVPLLARSIDENLQAKQAIDEKNYAQFVENTVLIDKVSSLTHTIQQRKDRIAHLRGDVELVESEMKNLRGTYSTTVDQLESLMRKEHILLRKLNHMYYKEVADKLGEPYAVQLSIVQQGQPYNAVIGPPPPGLPVAPAQQPSTPLYSQKPSLSATPAVRPGSASAAHSTQQLLPSSPAIAASIALQNSNPHITQLFLPSSINGTSLPHPPSTIPSFINAPSSSSSGPVAPTTIPLTPHSPLPSSTRTLSIDKHATLRDVDRVLEQNPSSASNVMRQAATRAKDQARKERHDALQAEQDEENDQPEEENASGFSPFFVLKPHQSSDDLEDEEFVDPEESEPEEADEAFALQREHFKRGMIAAVATVHRDGEEEKEPAATSTTAACPPRHRDPHLRQPSARIPPLHVRTISEIDWFAVGPVDPSAKRKKHLTAEEREAFERASKLTNPFVLFPTKDEEEAQAAEREEAQRAAEKRATEVVSKAQVVSMPTEWWSRKAVHAAVSAPVPKPRPPPKVAPALPPSPVPGMSSEQYAASFASALASLVRLGYPPNQALDFAPHLVLAGVVQAPAPKVEQITEPNNVAMVAARRVVRRSAPPPPPPPPFVQAPPPVSEELAWIGGMPGGEPYVFEAARPGQQLQRPGSASLMRPVGSFSARTSVGLVKRPGSAIPRVGAKTTVRPTSAATASARTNALYSGVPTYVASYQPAPRPHAHPPVVAAPHPPPFAAAPSSAVLAKPVAAVARRASLTGPIVPVESVYAPFLLSPHGQ
jgi:hypothetical protein